MYLDGGSDGEKTLVGGEGGRKWLQISSSDVFDHVFKLFVSDKWKS